MSLPEHHMQKTPAGAMPGSKSAAETQATLVDPRVQSTLLHLAKQPHSQVNLWKMIVSCLSDQHMQALVRTLAIATVPTAANTVLIRAVFVAAVEQNSPGAVRILRSVAHGSPHMSLIAIEVLSTFAGDGNLPAQADARRALEKLSAQSPHLRELIRHTQAAIAC